MGLIQIIDLFHVSTVRGEYQLFRQEKWSLTACAEMSLFRKGHCSRFPGIVCVCVSPGIFMPLSDIARGGDKY